VPRAVPSIPFTQYAPRRFFLLQPVSVFLTGDAVSAGLSLASNATSVAAGGQGGPLLEAQLSKYAALAAQMKIYIYELPAYFNADLVTRDPRILTHMFAAEVLIHYNLLNSSVRTLNPEEADLFFIPVYSTGDLNEQGRALPQMAGMMIKQVMHHVVHTWPYFNRTHGQDHVVVVPHDFGACFTFRVSKGGHSGGFQGLVLLMWRIVIAESL
jgi:hypothetical protein